MATANSFQGIKCRWLCLAVVLLLLGGVPLVEALHRLVADRAQQLQRIEALGVLSELRSRVESEFNSVLYIASGLISYVTVEPHSSEGQWSALSAEILRSSRHVRNIGLAPDNIVRFVYPLAGNESAIGLEYATNQEQWPAVKRAIDLGATLVAGPVNLVQGGRGFIARTPIHTHAGPGRPPEFWGMASVVIDMDSLFADAGIREVVDGFDIAIIGRDGLGLQGEMILGDPAVIDNSLARLEVNFPNGSWVMAAARGNREEPFWLLAQSVRLMGYSILLLLGLLFSTLIRLYHISHGEAMHDPLTGLPNRRLLMERMTQLANMEQRTGLGFALYFIDLNGFKPVNDLHGHAAGDAVLKKVGARLKAQVRRSDTVARTGGDEFMVLQPAMANGVSAQVMATRFERALAASFVYQGVALELSAAVGFAVYPGDANSIDKLISLADDRMFAHKAQGKRVSG